MAAHRRTTKRGASHSPTLGDVENLAADRPDIRRDARRPHLPAGPSLFTRIFTRSLLGKHGRQNGAQFMRSVAQTHGDVNCYKLGPRLIFQINHPELITDFFGRDAGRHHRSFVMQRARDVLGHGLLTSEEPLHMRQRRLAQPAFLRSRIQAYGAEIGKRTAALSDRWQPGTRDVHHDMLMLALEIVGKTLFDMDEVAEMAEIEDAVNAFMSFMPLAFLPFSRLIQRLPLRRMRRLNDGKSMLDRLIYGMIAERRAEGRDRGDLLSMLLAATDAEDPGDGAPAQSMPTQSMSDEQVRDECITIILAGHETTANALSFALHLLAWHPDAQQRIADEAVQVLGTRAPTAEDYPRLSYSNRVFAEAMRLYPPVWVTSRMAVEAYQVAGFTIPVGAAVLAPQFAVHRDPRWWPDPDRFDPDRFTEDAKAARPRNSYFPFGGGSRMCIGEGLAWMEGTLALAVLARDWKMSPPPGSTEVPLTEASITLRPAGGTPLVLERR